ncbi:MAG TPA: hypothetical protein VJU78_02125 [Chitinophagaceae bacterium]|nr:hypothetical protein [Chitinophagaceae bacterium]
MSKKITTAILVGATGIAIYILSKSIKEKQKRSLQKRSNEFRRRPGSAYAYEYTL